MLVNEQKHTAHLISTKEVAVHSKQSETLTRSFAIADLNERLKVARSSSGNWYNHRVSILLGKDKIETSSVDRGEKHQVELEKSSVFFQGATIAATVIPKWRLCSS